MDRRDLGVSLVDVKIRADKLALQIDLSGCGALSPNKIDDVPCNSELPERVTGAGGWSADLTEFTAHQSTGSAHVDTALGFGFELTHDFAHVFHFAGACSRHDFIDERGNFVVA